MLSLRKFLRDMIKIIFTRASYVYTVFAKDLLEIPRLIVLTKLIDQALKINPLRINC